MWIRLARSDTHLPRFTAVHPFGLETDAMQNGIRRHGTSCQQSTTLQPVQQSWNTAKADVWSVSVHRIYIPMQKRANRVEWLDNHSPWIDASIINTVWFVVHNCFCYLLEMKLNMIIIIKKENMEMRGKKTDKGWKYTKQESWGWWLSDVGCCSLYL